MFMIQRKEAKTKNKNFILHYKPYINSTHTHMHARTHRRHRVFNKKWNDRLFFLWKVNQIFHDFHEYCDLKLILVYKL